MDNKERRQKINKIKIQLKNTKRNVIETAKFNSSIDYNTFIGLVSEYGTIYLTSWKLKNGQEKIQKTFQRYQKNFQWKNNFLLNH